MRKLILPLLLVVALLMAACASAPAVSEYATPDEIYPRLSEAGSGFVLLDVRTQDEWEVDGHIEGAVLIPVDELPVRAGELGDPDAEIVIYCRSGNRSTQAAEYLRSAGFTQVRDMGGIRDWIAEGYPVLYGP